MTNGKLESDWNLGVVLVITIFGNIVLMTLFLAIFLREFDNVDALRDENMVTTIQIKQISSKLKRKLTLSVATSV